MRFFAATTLALSGSALAMSQAECFAQNNRDLAEFSDCGHHGSLAYCFTQLPSSETSDIENCYMNAGCSASQAAAEIRFAQERCQEWTKMGDLKKRYRGVLEHVERTVAAREAGSAPTPTLAGRDDPLQCLTTTTVSTSSCPLQTDGGKVKTLSCFPTVVASSACGPGLLCSLDTSGKQVCMKTKSIDVGGIIIAIVLGVALIGGLTAVTFLSCKESRQQKRLEAKAEATALARAQTKKARAQESRAPLMRQQDGGDPFHDRAQH